METTKSTKATAERALPKRNPKTGRFEKATAKAATAAKPVVAKAAATAKPIAKGKKA
jgi:hypothetical protein